MTPERAPVIRPALTSAAKDREARRGARPYLDILADLHRLLDPRGYVEIGVRAGNSLRLARCPALGIDPRPVLDPRHPLPATTRVLRLTSDAWAVTGPVPDFPLDLAFIDGLHHADQVARDFLHLESLAHAGTLVVLDDCYPNHPAQATRQQTTRAWTGDVWLFVEALATTRPDLTLTPLDSHPTGLLLISGLGAPSTPAQAERLQAACANERQVPPTVLARTGALDPATTTLGAVCAPLRARRAAMSSVRAMATADDLQAVRP